MRGYQRQSGRLDTQAGARDGTLLDGAHNFPHHHLQYGHYPGSPQRGFSLVELMVAMVVSLVLLAGILQILLDNRESFEMQQTLAALQQNGRFAVFRLENAIMHAGYRVALKNDPDDLFSDHVISGTNEDPSTSTPAKQGSDTLRIRFQASGGLRNCAGKTVGDTDKPGIADFKLYVGDNNKLVCTVYDPFGDPVKTVPLIDHVQTFQIRYGLDTDGDHSVDTYSNAPNEWNQVRSVRVQLLLKSAANVLPTAIKHMFVFADGQIIKTNDRRARHLVDQTIALRNLLP